MRVLFLTLYPESAASPRYRVHQFLPHLRAAGVACDVACAVDPAFWAAYRAPGSRLRPRDYLLHERRRRREQLRDARGYDVVFLQKAITSVYWRGMSRLLEPLRERLVFDIDDAVHIDPPDRLPRVLRLFEDTGQARKIMALARVTLAGNVWLAEEAQAAGGRPAVFPTVVDTGHYTPAPQPDDAYRLGWMGSPGTAPYLKLIEGPMRDSGGEHLIIGAGQEPLPFPAEQRDWFQEDELAQLHRMSVGLMPMPDTPWTRGKCALKALLCMACGRPAICSAGGAADAIIAHGKNGFLARTDQDWRDAIDALRDPALRARMGAAARATIEERYSLKGWAPRLRELLEAAA